MSQLGSHFFILYLVYRGFKVMYHEWTAFKVALYLWFFVFLLVNDVIGTYYWWYRHPNFVISLRIGFYTTSIFIAIFFVYFWLTLTRIYLYFTEWTWDYLYFEGKEQLIRKYRHFFFLLYNEELFEHWLTWQIYPFRLKRNWKTAVVKNLRFLLYLVTFCFAIRLWMLPSYFEFYIKIQLYFTLYPWNIILALPLIYNFSLITKWYFIYIFPYVNNGYKSPGLIYAPRLMYTDTWVWARKDILKRDQKQVVLYDIFNLYIKRYRLPRSWTSWHQSVVDHVPYIYLASKIINFTPFLYKIYVHNFMLENKTGRFDEFNYENAFFDPNDKRFDPFVPRSPYGDIKIMSEDDSDLELIVSKFNII